MALGALAEQLLRHALLTAFTRGKARQGAGPLGPTRAVRAKTHFAIPSSAYMACWRCSLSAATRSGQRWSGKLSRWHLRQETCAKRLSPRSGEVRAHVRARSCPGNVRTRNPGWTQARWTSEPGTRVGARPGWVGTVRSTDLQALGVCAGVDAHDRRGSACSSPSPRGPGPRPGPNRPVCRGLGLGKVVDRCDPRHHARSSCVNTAHAQRPPPRGPSTHRHRRRTGT